MKKLLSAFMAVLILTGALCSPVMASEAPETDTSLVNSTHGVPIVEPPGEDDVIDFSRFEGKSLEEIINEFLEERQVETDRLSFGFYNTVTGEEYYHNGDKYMVAASVYKLPLNMYFSEKVYLGEIDWSTRFGNIPYENIQVSSIVSSNNELSEMLQREIGDYREYRTAIAKYLGVNIRTVEERYYEGNDFTARQIINALRMLYSDYERYPRVISYMLLGAPNNYFAYSEHRYQIAHKYGYIEYDGHLIYNDAAIVYTPDPILLVMFTDNCSRAIPNMTAFCSLMCDYSEYTRYLRESAPAEPEITPEPEDSPELSPIPTAQTPSEPTPGLAPKGEKLPAPTPSAEPEPQVKEPFELTKIHKLMIVAAAAGLLSILFFLMKKMRPLSKVIAIIMLMIFGISAVALCTIAVGNAINGTLFPDKPEKTPEPQTPVVSSQPESLATPVPEAPVIREYVLGDESYDEIIALADIENLEYVDGSASTEYAAMRELSSLRPDCRVDYSVELYGIQVSVHDTELKIADFSITDPQPLMEKLAYLPALEKLDIKEPWFENEDVAALMEKYPDIDIVWTVSAGRWYIPSDAVCFSTRQLGEPAYRYTSEELAPIFKYCTELVALDLSHNALTDISGIENLSKLQVLLLGDNSGITDVSPLASLKQLRYLELYRAKADDWSCLASLEKLTDINLSYCAGVDDISFLDSLPELERAWLRGTAVAPPDWDSIIRKYENVKFLFWHDSGASNAGGWDRSERALAVRKALENWYYVDEFRAWDDIVYWDESNLNPVY